MVTCNGVEQVSPDFYYTRLSNGCTWQFKADSMEAANIKVADQLELLNNQERRQQERVRRLLRKYPFEYQTQQL